jgi:TRAP-type C4-dicarboxylate transport system substrate-binding protein
MSHAHSTSRAVFTLSLLTAATLLVAGCAPAAPDSSADTGGGAEESSDVTLTVATSQPETTPNFYCGVELLKERLEEADLGFTVELYPASQLGPDTERFAAVQAGDIDIDLQGASALSATYEPIGVVDAAYVFNDVDHAFDWIDNESADLFASFNEETGTRIVDGWFFGNRTFTTKDTPIVEPDDLKDLAIRFPDSPQFLANAEAMGVTPVAVANEEIYVALQQGIAVGQENPIVATHSQSFDEILKVASLNNHQVGIHWLVVSDATYDKLSDEQAELLDETLHSIRAENRECVEEETDKILDEYRADSSYTVVEEEDVDKDAFITQAEEFFGTYYDGERLELYENIRGMVE